MKPHFHLVPRNTEYPYLCRQHTLPNFGSVWHYHPELELHYIIRGEGVRFVGDNISNFEEGELLFLGAGLPHMWRCSDKYFAGDPQVTAEAIVVQFLSDFMGKEFMMKKESAALHRLFDRARYGFVIHGATKRKVLALMKQSVGVEGFDRLVLIMNMVHALVSSKEMTQIASGVAVDNINMQEINRINSIYSYMLNHYKEDISLQEIASVAHLTVTSFCRYFKTMTKKSFTDFLVEIRISHAKRMLIEGGSYTTESICYECGFNNRSNFFRHFRKLVGCTPVEYRQRYLSLEEIM
ncbi:MAG: AraC family transcriptional regulator [Chitinophagaceae bacterium]|nr:AraC family transcriptional regulator [Chitinophagaceae bacterium]